MPSGDKMVLAMRYVKPFKRIQVRPIENYYRSIQDTPLYYSQEPTGCNPLRKQE
jgi:hypothetical protein